MARAVGFEPTTNRLTADCSTAELRPNTVHGSGGREGAYLVSPAGRVNRGKRDHSGRHPSSIPERLPERTAGQGYAVQKHRNVPDEVASRDHVQRRPAGRLLPQLRRRHAGTGAAGAPGGGQAIIAACRSPQASVSRGGGASRREPAAPCAAPCRAAASAGRRKALRRKPDGPSRRRRWSGSRVFRGLPGWRRAAIIGGVIAPGSADAVRRLSVCATKQDGKVLIVKVKYNEYIKYSFKKYGNFLFVLQILL